MASMIARLATVLGLAALPWPQNAEGIEITDTFGGLCKVVLEGEIRRGDTQKLRKAVAAFEPDSFADVRGNPDWSVCLDSVGGSYSESVEMAQFISEAGISTYIDDSMECYSACALVFMAGRTSGAESDYVNRNLHVRGRLGFHAPYLEVPPGNYDELTVNQAYRQALISIANYLEFANKPGKFDVRPRVSPNLIGELLYHDRNSMYMIDTVNKAGRFEIILFGYRQPEITKETLKNVCANELSWRRDEFSRDENAFIVEESLRYVKQRTGVMSGVRTVTRLDASGLVGYWCDIYVAEHPDRPATLILCAIDGEREYGYDCHDRDEAFGVLARGYALFAPQTKLEALDIGPPVTQQSNASIGLVGQRRRRDARPSGGAPVPPGWQIQVGAFVDLRAAAIRLREALRRARAVLAGREEGVLVYSGEPLGSSVYRVRIVGFGDEAAARTACNELIEGKIDCFVAGSAE